MTAQQVLGELQPLGKTSYKRVLMNNHGVTEPCFGVPISELKKFQKRFKHNHQLALDLYATGNYDAMYLAGLVADPAQMTKPDLQRWLKNSQGGALGGTTLAGVAAESPHGRELALAWIDSGQSHVAAVGWATLAHLVSIKPDAELNLPELGQLLDRVRTTIHQAPDAVRYQMNAFVIATGSYVAALTALALQVAEQVGPVTADLGNNSCHIPFAPDYIRKVQQRSRIGKKRHSARC
ncbi:MAG TPA: DNA alkylation repair protein [Prosthecobacter sp.]|nr:DNA alkylation repair protein [Prosthecobacter sp.]